MDETVIALLKRKIAEHQEELKTFLANGGAEDMTAYARLVGRNEALNLIGGELEDLEQRLVEE